MSEKKLWVDLSDEDLAVLTALQAELGVDNLNDVMRALIRQAHTRATIVCPACGHSAQLTAQDEARCESCMSVLQLSDQLWTVAATRVAQSPAAERSGGGKWQVAS